MMKSKRRGFTLIELLVVIAIIGILSSVVLASLNSARQKSRDAKRISDVKQLQLALELSFDDNATYPADTSGLVGAGYIPALPADPQGGAYVYEQLSSGTSYVVRATLENTGHSALTADIDGNPVVAGASTNCGDASDSEGYYCARP